MLLFLFSCFHPQKQTLSDVTVPTELGPYGTVDTIRSAGLGGRKLASRSVRETLSHSIQVNALCLAPFLPVVLPDSVCA